MHNKLTTNIVLVGLGGQGVLTASDILARAALRSGYLVKKSEIKGMSQRGGTVTSDVRFGQAVFSPMVPAGEADFLVVLDPSQAETQRFWLSKEGVLISPSNIDVGALPTRKSLNVALLGALSAQLPIAEADWLDSLHAAFPEDTYSSNRSAFAVGRRTLQPMGL